MTTPDSRSPAVPESVQQPNRAIYLAKGQTLILPPDAATMNDSDYGEDASYTPGREVSRITFPSQPGKPRRQLAFIDFGGEADERPVPMVTDKPHLGTARARFVLERLYDRREERRAVMEVPGNGHPGFVAAAPNTELVLGAGSEILSWGLESDPDPAIAKDHLKIQRNPDGSVSMTNNSVDGTIIEVAPSQQVSLYQTSTASLAPEGWTSSPAV